MAHLVHGTTVPDLIDVIADGVMARVRAAQTEGCLPPVDLHAQIDPYLAEGRTRCAATKVEVGRTLDWFLSCCDLHGLAYDSKQAAAAYKKYLTARGISDRTLNFHLGRVSQFLRWAAAHGYVESDPVSGVKVASNTGRAVHEEREAVPRAMLQAFLRTLDLRREPKAFLPLLLAYSGARLNEIASLYLDNIRQLDGLWAIEIGDKYEGQSIKNPQSRRLVPVHSKLLELGLIEHCDRLRRTGEQRLFACWSVTRPGKYGGVWLRSYLANIHGIRHRVGTDLVRAGVSEPIVNRIMGHSAFDSMLSRYFKGHELTVLKDAIEKLDYTRSS